MVGAPGIEPELPDPKSGVLPLDHTPVVGHAGIEPTPPGPEPGVLPLNQWPVVGVTGLEPAPDGFVDRCSSIELHSQSPGGGIRTPDIPDPKSGGLPDWPTPGYASDPHGAGDHWGGRCRSTSATVPDAARHVKRVVGPEGLEPSHLRVKAACSAAELRARVLSLVHEAVDALDGSEVVGASRHVRLGGLPVGGGHFDLPLLEFVVEVRDVPAFQLGFHSRPERIRTPNPGLRRPPLFR